MHAKHCARTCRHAHLETRVIVSDVNGLASARTVKQQRTHDHRCAQAVGSNGAAAVKQQLKDWHDVDQPALWRGTEDEALAEGSPLSQLPAPWKMILLSDGSVTRHLQLLTGQPVSVECMQMDLLAESQLHKPPDKALEIPGPLVQRQVLLWSQTQVPLVYAASWWASATVDSYLADKNLPIWVSLAKGHLELYREIQLVGFGHNSELEEYFDCSGPFWGRQYYFWHSGAPLTLIHEVFSNKLSEYLGPPSYHDAAATAAGQWQQHQQGSVGSNRSSGNSRNQ